MRDSELSEAEVAASKKAFSDLGVCSELCDAIAAMRYKEPTDIQQQALPPLLQGVLLFPHDYRLGAFS